MASVYHFIDTTDGSGNAAVSLHKLTHDQAQHLTAHRLDRRKNYALIEGELHEQATWSQACTGCYEGHNTFSSRGNGCDECGYQGRVRTGAWIPVLTSIETRPRTSTVST